MDMARWMRNSMEMIGYILTPEFSQMQEQHARVPGNWESPKKRVMGYVKSAAWLLVSIMLGLSLGQLN
jgi:hypothetical protein